MSTKIQFEKKELAGSRLRCLMMTSFSRERTVGLLRDIVAPFGDVEQEDKWAPNGFRNPKETKLGNSDFLDDSQRSEITNWWLRVVRRANTPNWDLVSTCKVDGRPGLLLVEAKAHRNETSHAGKSADGANEENHKSIRDAISEANDGLSDVEPGWNLSAKSHYQLANRFAWAWKLASMQVPVVLVFLGFLNACEMKTGKSNQIFSDPNKWRDSVLKFSNGIVPKKVWNQPIRIGGTPLIPLIRSVNIGVTVPDRA